MKLLLAAAETYYATPKFLIMSYKPTFNELQDRGLLLQNKQPGTPLIFKDITRTRCVGLGTGGRVSLWVGNGSGQWQEVWHGVPDSSYDFNTLYEELVEDGVYQEFAGIPNA